MNRRLCLVVAALLAASVSAGCASASDAASTRAIDELAPATTAEASPTTVETEPVQSHCDEVPRFDPLPSFAPIGPAPEPGMMPAGTSMREIQDRGSLRVGVDENTKYFSYRDPSDDSLQGFEPDLARLIARAIFGDTGDPIDTRIRFEPVVTQNKIDVVTDGEVDMTISVVSKSCRRWDEVDFTSTYYETTQRIMVGAGSSIAGLADLDGRYVCVTEGSSSETFLQDATQAVVVSVEARTDCLVALQEREVDAVVLPYSILAGLHSQDPSTRILDFEPGLPPQSYGIPIEQDDLELVRFVNALLERWRTDGTLAGLQEQHLPSELWTSPAAPPPAYRAP